MSVLWHYVKDSAQYGPVPWEHLKALLATGQLQADDQVWSTEPGATPVRAGDVVQLGAGAAAALSAGASASGEQVAVEAPPPAEDEADEPAAGDARPDGWRRLRDGLATLASDTRSAGVLAARCAQRIKLEAVTLPRLYLALGRHVRQQGGFRDDFPRVHARLDELAAEMASLRAAPEGEFDSWLDSVSQLASQAAAQPRLELLASRARRQLRRLGRMAFEKHGAEAGPDDLTAPLAAATARLDQVEEDIARLSAPQPGKLLTPKRIAIGGAAAVAVSGMLAASVPKALLVTRRAVGL